MGRAAADVEGLLRHLVGSADRRLVGAKQIVDVQDVAHLLAVAEDGDVAPEDRGDDEPGNPALILHAELARPVDARLPERRRGDAVDPGEVEGVLVGGALGAAVGREEVERLGLADAVRPVAVDVAVAAQLASPAAATLP